MTAQNQRIVKVQAERDRIENGEEEDIKAILTYIAQHIHRLEERVFMHEEALEQLFKKAGITGEKK